MGIAGLVVLLVSALIGFIATAVDGGGSSSGSGSPPGGYAPELESEWILTSLDVTKDYSTFGSVDGSVSGELLETAYGWVTMIEPATPEATLVLVDPETGAPLWTLPLPEALCTLHEDSLVCLTRTGTQFDLVTVAPETGEVVGDPVATELTHVPQFLTMMGSDAVVVLSVDAQLTGIGINGRTLWSDPIEFDSNYELEWLTPDIAHIGDSAILALGWAVGTISASPAGAVLHPCENVAATEEAWLCVGEDDAIAYGTDGSELWRGPWNDYYLIDRYNYIAPVMLVDNWDGTISPIDPLTGAHGQPIPVSQDDGDAAFNFLGDTEHPVVFTYETVSLLDADLTTVLWTAPVEDDYLNIAGGGIVGDTLAIDAQHSYGFDLNTGEMLWERAFLSDSVYAIGDAFVNVRSSELVRYELP